MYKIPRHIKINLAIIVKSGIIDFALPVITPPTTKRLCHDCGSPLILEEENKLFIENSYSETTITTYICSNADCQKKKDAQEAKRLQGIQDDIARKKASEAAKKA